MTKPRVKSFSLLELIVVMVLLTIGTALVAPRLAGFFQGRRLDDEARRIWALTRFAREEAIVQAIPMRLWIDNQNRRYGLEALAGYGSEYPPRRYDLAPHLEVQAELADGRRQPEASLIWWADGSLSAGSAAVIVLQDSRHPADAWRIARHAPLSVFSLQREDRL